MSDAVKLQEVARTMAVRKLFLAVPPTFTIDWDLSIIILQAGYVILTDATLAVARSIFLSIHTALTTAFYAFERRVPWCTPNFQYFPSCCRKGI